MLLAWTIDELVAVRPRGGGRAEGQRAKTALFTLTSFRNMAEARLRAPMLNLHEAEPSGRARPTATAQTVQAVAEVRARASASSNARHDAPGSGCDAAWSAAPSDSAASASASLLSLLWEKVLTPTLLTLLPSLRVQALTSRLSFLLLSSLVEPAAVGLANKPPNGLPLACCCKWANRKKNA